MRLLQWWTKSSRGLWLGIQCCRRHRRYAGSAAIRLVSPASKGRCRRRNAKQSAITTITARHFSSLPTTGSTFIACTLTTYRLRLLRIRMRAISQTRYTSRRTIGGAKQFRASNLVRDRSVAKDREDRIRIEPSAYEVSDKLTLLGTQGTNYMAMPSVKSTARLVK